MPLKCSSASAALDGHLLESVGMPELGRRPICLANRGLVGGLGARPRILACWRHRWQAQGICSSLGKSIERGTRLFEQLASFDSCFFKPSTICAGALEKALIVQLALGGGEALFAFCDVLRQPSRSAATSTCAHRPQRLRSWDVECFGKPGVISATNRTSLTRARRSTVALFSLDYMFDAQNRCALQSALVAFSSTPISLRSARTSAIRLCSSAIPFQRIGIILRAL